MARLFKILKAMGSTKVEEPRQKARVFPQRLPSAVELAKPRDALPRKPPKPVQPAWMSISTWNREVPSKVAMACNPKTRDEMLPVQMFCM